MKNFKELLNFPIEIPFERINKRLKLPRKYRDKNIEKIIRGFLPLIETSARYFDFPFSSEDSEIKIDERYTINSSSLSKHLENSEKVTLIAVTIGKYVEEKCERFQRKGIGLKAMVGDAVGSECVEEAAKYMSNIIGNNIRKNGYGPTKRFSPGYGDLSLKTQNIFFQELKLNEIGITINDSYLMTPQKSITAFIGWERG